MTKRSFFPPVIIVFFVCLFTYGNSFHHGFLLDDYPIFFGQWSVGTVVSPIQFFTQEFQGFYRPLGYLFLKYLHELCGTEVFGYHAVNFILFFSICALVFCVTNKLVHDGRLALLTGVLYAVHPINNMLVNYKPAGSLSLFVIFMALSFLFLLDFTEGKSRSYYFGSLFFYLLSLLTHEVSSMLPAYMLFMLYFVHHFSWKKSVLWALPYAGIFILYLVLRSFIQHLRPIDGLFHLSIVPASYFATIAYLIFWYLSKLIFPHDILFLWDSFVLTQDLWVWNLFLALALALVSYCILRYRHDRVLVFSSILFLLGFVPFGLASFVYTGWFKTAIIEPHWFGFSSIGFFLLAAHGINSMQGKMSKPLWIVLVILVVGSLAVTTREHNKFWKDEETYCSYWLRVNPADLTAKKGKAEAYIRKHDKGVDPQAYSDEDEVASLIKSAEVLGDDQKTEGYKRILFNLGMNRSKR